MDVNFIVTCFNRETYLPGLKEIFASYKNITSHVAMCYNGEKPDFECDVRIKNLGHQKGDQSLTLAGYDKLKDNGITRWIKIAIDSWLLDDTKLIEIFNKMEEQQAAYGGNHWNGSGCVSTDIFFVDTRYGNVFEKLREQKDGSFETMMQRSIESGKFKMYIIPERVKVHSGNRHKCDKLSWAMFHNLEENIQYRSKFLNKTLVSTDTLIDSPKINIKTFGMGEIKLITDFPIALDSPDHTHPMGTKQDNYTNPKFISIMTSRLKKEFPKSRLSFMDLGCAGGRLVKDFLDANYISVGLEGSDYSRVNKRAAWPELLMTHLFTCDLSKPFQVTYINNPAKFTLITAWEFLEHINTKDQDTLWENIINHLTPGGYFCASISYNSVRHEGVELHQTRWKPEQWKDYIKKLDRLESIDLGLTPQQCVRNANNGGSDDYLFYKRR